MPDKPFRFISGDDDYLVTQQGKEWYARQTEGLSDDLSMEVIDGRAGNVAEVETVLGQFRSAVQTLSLFGERKVVWLRNISFIADNPTGRAEGTLQLLDDLKDLLASLDPAAVAVLLTASPVDKRRAFYKWCQKTADHTALAGGGDSASLCRKLAADTIAEAGARMDPEAIKLLVAKVGSSTRLVAEECRKLATAIAHEDRVIDEALVTELVPNFGDADFFEAAEVFYTLDLGATLEALERHFFTVSEARPLLASLQGRNRLMIQLRALIDAGAVRPGSRGLSKADLERAAARFGGHFPDDGQKSNLNVFSQNPWYLGRLATAAARIPLKRLLRFQMALAEAFEGLLGRSNEQEEVMRELAVRCLAE